MIQIKCAGHTFEREIGLILALFYEDPEIVYVGDWDDSQPGMRIFLSVNHTDQGARAHGRLHAEGREFSFDYTRPYVSGDPKAVQKTAKQAVSYTLLCLLEQLTGIEQGWGILTGIRPTKLLHKLLTSGMSREEAHRHLREDYMVRPYKLELLQRIVDRQLRVVPDFYQIDRELSVYIGIPFCPTKCAYCTFPAYAIGGQKNSVGGFLEGLRYEIRSVGDWLRRHDMRITSIYFGGGTPTSITAEELDSLFQEMHASFPNLEHVRELTVEAGRPDTITPEKIDVMKKWKVDRISINPQSFTDETLHAIGRHHSVQETVEKYRLAMEMGLTNINMDLIIGLPNEGLADVKHSLAEVEKLMPSSLTVHTLSFKRASEMTQNKEKYRVAGRTEIQQMMELASRWTEEHGYVPYYLYRQKNILGNLENIGYSLEGCESIYNILMMEEAQTILGLGCGAVSKLMAPGSGKLTRWANPKDPKTYNDTYKQLVADKLRDLEELYSKGVELSR
ncbi:coproporphyrinogen III oxidase [Brevibacillus massiliensis]|uniref:coproporphyrinogen III oxidase n=1 Tax=Brevibacillus massiliensis TaxID=1118054 RepID=UPI0002FC8C5C|nr:coproporphyrinogen III oxidase [Brevibacillus massiliensis]